MKKLLSILILLSATLLAACSSPATPAEPQYQEFTITTTEFGFTPDTIEVKLNQPVRITVKNAGTLEHNFSVEIPAKDIREKSSPGAPQQHDHDAPSVHTMAMAGEIASVTFTPTEAGTYTFTCSVSGHKEAGMTGTLIVKP